MDTRPAQSSPAPQGHVRADVLDSDPPLAFRAEDMPEEPVGLAGNLLRGAAVALLLALLALSTGCDRQPRPERPLGSSVRLALESQKAFPDPVTDTTPPDMDGELAAGSLKAYRNPDRSKSSGKSATSILITPAK